MQVTKIGLDEIKKRIMEQPIDLPKQGTWKDLNNKDATKVYSIDNYTWYFKGLKDMRDICFKVIDDAENSIQ